MAKFIEMHISANDLRAFVFENTQDYNLFMNTMRDEQGLKVNAVKAPNRPVNEYKPNQELLQLLPSFFVELVNKRIV